LIHAHILALKNFVESGGDISGKSFAISDQNPIDNFEFVGLIISGLGFQPPQMNLPFWLMFCVAHLVEIVHKLISPLYPHSPFLTRAEVCKVAITHYFSPEESTHFLHYTPIVPFDAAVKETIQYYKNYLKEQKINQRANHWLRWYIIIFFAFSVLVVFIFCSIKTPKLINPKKKKKK